MSTDNRKKITKQNQEKPFLKTNLFENKLLIKVIFHKLDCKCFQERSKLRMMKDLVQP
jgi:hypothetical protein